MKIINYSSEYDDSIKDLLVELQEYIVGIDKEKFNILTTEYKEKYFVKTMKEVKKYEGKIFLAKEKDKIVGLVVGIINNEFEENYESTIPKCGRITELIVSNDYRYNNIGKKILDSMENYFKKVGCKCILTDVFGYNENAQKFYYKNGYFNINIEVMKKI